MGFIKDSENVVRSDEISICGPKAANHRQYQVKVSILGKIGIFHGPTDENKEKKNICIFS